MLANFRGPTPRQSAEAIAAMKHAVPDAVNQFSSKSAAYGVLFGTTGATCVIMLWRPGTAIRFSLPVGVGCVTGCARTVSGMNPSVHVLTFALIVGAPNVSTATTSSMYGSHAINTCFGVCLTRAMVMGLSPS